MSLRKSRRFICFLLTIVISVGAVTFIGMALAKLTICNSSYMKIFMHSDKIVSACEKSYNDCLEALSEETGIPVRVYQAAKDKFVIIEGAVESMYLNHNASLYSNDKIEIYEKLCREYLDGNNISYNRNDVYDAACKATEIYSQCYGISDFESLYMFVNEIGNKSVGIIAVGLFLTVVPFILMLMIFKKKENLISQLFATLSCVGFSLVLFGLTGIVFGIGTNIMLAPSIYANAVATAVRVDFLLITAVGLLISAAAVYGAFRTNQSFIEKRLAEK